MLKIAAIDVGSNSMRMTVGSLDENWLIEIVENIRLPVRLGEDVFSTGSHGSTTMRQSQEAFLRFRHAADSHGVARMRAVATSAAREAANSDLLVDRIQQSSGIELEIISGEEEARLINLAVSHELKLKNKRALLIDIGGGSVEVSISNGQSIISTDSYNMGAVRLIEKLDGRKKSKHTFAKLVREYAEGARRRLEREIGTEKIAICAGTGGNVEEIGRLGQKLLKTESDRSVTVKELEKIIEIIDNLSYSERMRKLKLRPDRADVILPAAIVLHFIAKEAEVDKISIPNTGLKEGVMLDIAEEFSKTSGARYRSQAWESALQLGRKYQFDEQHALLTSRLASRIFRQTKALHNMGEENLLLLEIGALLHDVGHFISAVDHDKHAYYLLQATRLIGLGRKEQDIVANMVRYHRKRNPTTNDKNFKALSRKNRAIALKLCALLRIADSVDVCHTANPVDVSLREAKTGWKISILGKDDPLLESWSIKKRKSLFQDVFGVSLELEAAKRVASSKRRKAR